MKCKIIITVDNTEVGDVVTWAAEHNYKLSIRPVKETETQPILRVVETFKQAEKGFTPRPTVAGVREENGTPISQTHRGRIILAVFKTLPIAHGADLEEAMVKAGYAGTSWGDVASKLRQEGAIIRIKRGVYRAAPRATDSGDGGDRCQAMSG